MSPEFMQECLQFQMQLLNKLTPPEELNFTDFNGNDLARTPPIFTNNILARERPTDETGSFRATKRRQYAIESQLAR